jgi:DNA-binding CsgD family transcriptional regulator
MDDVLVADIPSNNTPDIIPSETPIKSFKTLIERNKEITERFANGVSVKTIALEYGISEPQVYSVVRNHPGIISNNRELEKVRRLRRLRLCENKAPKNLAPKDSDQLVKVLEAQRKELEGDNQSSNTTQTINVQINAINTNNQQELWEQARKLLGI